MDLVAWLRGLGLEQYAPVFRDNDAAWPPFSTNKANSGMSQIGFRCVVRPHSQRGKTSRKRHHQRRGPGRKTPS